MESVSASEFAFGHQVRLGLQPMLHIVPRERALVHVAEVCPSSDFFRGWGEIDRSFAKVRSRDRWRFTKWGFGLMLAVRRFVVFHTRIAD